MEDIARVDAENRRAARQTNAFFAVLGAIIVATFIAIAVLL